MTTTNPVISMEELCASVDQLCEQPPGYSTQEDDASEGQEASTSVSMVCASVLAIIGLPEASYPLGAKYHAHHLEPSIAGTGPSHEAPPAPYEGRSAPSLNPQPTRHTHSLGNRRNTLQQRTTGGASAQEVEQHHRLTPPPTYPAPSAAKQRSSPHHGPLRGTVPVRVPTDSGHRLPHPPWEPQGYARLPGRAEGGPHP